MLSGEICKISKSSFFTEDFQWLLLTFNSCFQRGLEKKPVRQSAINTISSWKKYLLPRKSRSSHRRYSVKEDLQRSAQVFFCEYCKIFKNTYFEKHLWTAASENQDFSNKFTERRYFLSFIIFLIKAFSTLNFAMTECFFSLIHVFFSYHKKVHIKWDVVTSSWLILMKVWIWYRWQNRLETYYPHDGEQLGFYKKVHNKIQSIMHRAKRTMFFVIFTLQETNEFQFI